MNNKRIKCDWLVLYLYGNYLTKIVMNQYFKI